MGALLSFVASEKMVLKSRTKATGARTLPSVSVRHLKTVIRLKCLDPGMSTGKSINGARAAKVDQYRLGEMVLGSGVWCWQHPRGTEEGLFYGTWNMELVLGEETSVREGIWNPPVCGQELSYGSVYNFPGHLRIR